MTTNGKGNDMKNMMTSIGKGIVKTVLTVLPANTLAALVAEYVTKALQKIKDRARMAKVSEAVSATGDAVKTTAEAVHDCKISEEEVNLVSDKIEVAVQKIIEAAK